MANKLMGVTALATGLAGMTVALSGCGALSATTYHEDRRYEVPGGLSGLDLRLDSANVEIVGADTDRISVHERLSWTKELKPTTEHRREGDTLVLRHRCPRAFSFGFSKCQVRYQVQMPRTMVTKVRSDAGDIRIRGVEGAVQADAGSGTITATDLRGGPVNATADSGNIVVDGAGSVQARADSGNIVVDGAGSVQVRADSGNIELRRLSGGRVVADSDAGNVIIAFAKDRPPNSVQATADSGNVIIRLPATVSYAFAPSMQQGSPRITGLTIDPTSSRTVTARADSGTIDVSAA